MVKKAKTKSKQPHPLQVRTSESIRERLQKAADAAGRTLSKEMERRLEASLEVSKPAEPGLPDALTYGWANPGGAKALGDALGLLAGRIEDFGAGPSETPWQPGIYGLVRVGGKELEPAEKMALLKLAIARVLDALGARASLSSEQTAFADLIARQFINDFQRVEPDPEAYSQRSDLAVVALLKSWLDATKKDEGKMTRRVHPPKVTQADLGRVAAFLKAMGAKVAAVDLRPGTARITTTDGQNLTLDSDEAELDQELEEYRSRNDQRPT